MLALLVLLTGLLPATSAADPGETEDRSDPRAVRIARSVMEKMGGQASWDSTRYLRWTFFGRRRHTWDRFTGNIRIEDGDQVTLMNIRTLKGKVFKGGEEVTDPAELKTLLEQGHQIWVNDSYWMFMPYKLLDPGVTLGYAGTRAMADGRPADVLILSFDKGIGYTPENHYDVFVAKDTGLVEQWSFYKDGSQEKPGFTLPWAAWRRFGKIMLAMHHGRDMDWAISVPEDLPAAVLTNPEAAGN
ncbi:MAG: hypothetical protein ACE5ID_01360 [Acidobacteriota bacterium]